MVTYHVRETPKRTRYLEYQQPCHLWPPLPKVLSVILDWVIQTLRIFTYGEHITWLGNRDGLGQEQPLWRRVEFSRGRWRGRRCSPLSIWGSRNKVRIWGFQEGKSLYEVFNLLGAFPFNHKVLKLFYTISLMLCNSLMPLPTLQWSSIHSCLSAVCLNFHICKMEVTPTS